MPLRYTRRHWLKAFCYSLGYFFSRGAAAAYSSPGTIGRLDPYDLLAYRATDGSIRRARHLREWLKRRNEIVDAMQEIMGPLPANVKRCPLDVRVEAETNLESCRRQLLTYQAEPGSRAPAYLLLPHGALRGKRKSPAVLALHQTTARGHEVVVGLGDNRDDQYGLELAERGFVCLAPAYPLLAKYHPNLEALGYVSGSMKAVWDNIRGVDLLSALPFVDPGRIGAIGHSLGGHNAVFTAVFEPRLRVIVSSCGLDSFADYMGGNIKGWTSPRYMPRLLNYPRNGIPFDFPEVVGALAPRVCLLSAPFGDSNFKWWSVDKVGFGARQVYRLAGRPGNLQIRHPTCDHRFPPEMRQLAYQLLQA